MNSYGIKYQGRAIILCNQRLGWLSNLSLNESVNFFLVNYTRTASESSAESNSITADVRDAIAERLNLKPNIF